MKEIKIKGAGETIFEHTLKNGFRVYIWKYNLSEEVSLSLTVKYGSVHTKFKVGGQTYEVPKGIAHFLEHIKFNETKDMTAHDYYNKLGSYVNAYTTYDHTSYEVVCNENIKDNLNHLLYFVLNPFFTKRLIQKEKPIIIEEAKMVLNNPYNIGYDTLQKNLYIENNKKYLVTGMPEDIKSITIEDAQNVFRNFYHPKNMFLTITGNVNPYEIEKIVDEYFNNQKFDKYSNPEIICKKEPNEVAKKHDEVKTNVTKEKLLKSYKIPKKSYKVFDDLHLRILFNIIMDLNFGTTSEFNDYVISNNLVDEIYYMVSVEEEQIIITFEISSSYPIEISKKLDEQMNELNCLTEDFERKKKVLIASTILGYEDATDVNIDIRNSIIKYDKIIANMKDIFSEITFKDGEKIIELLKKYQTTEVILKPNSKM